MGALYGASGGRHYGTCFAYCAWNRRNYCLWGGDGVAVGIALQNVPEGMIIIAPMFASGMRKKRTFVIASFTGSIEVIGTFIGYSAVNISGSILPFALSLAGGTMLYVIGDERIPETHSNGNETTATYAMIAGFFLMLCMD